MPSGRGPAALAATACGVLSIMVHLEGVAAQHAQHLPYFNTNLIVMEAENFTAVTSSSSSSWEAKPWMLSANRFAASVADTYLSRRAYLQGAAKMGAGASATMEFEVEPGEEGDYQVLLRYEAAFHFETPVHLSIAQQGARTPSLAASPWAGKLVFNRTYGQRHSLKVKPCALKSFHKLSSTVQLASSTVIP